MRRQLCILMLLIIAMLLSSNFILPSQALPGSSTASAAPPSQSTSNLALGKPATQSSTDRVNGFDAVASRAVDGDINGDISGGGVSQTLPEVHAWWQVDLEAVGLIETVEIYKQTDCCVDQGFYLLVSDVPFASYDLKKTIDQPEVTSSFHFFNRANLIIITTTPKRTGRYVRVQLLSDIQENLRLAEVQVKGVTLSTAPATAGQWSPTKLCLEAIPVHISLLPSGKLLFWSRDKREDGYDKDGESEIRLWDPISNTYTRKDLSKTNLFCSGHSFLPNGDLFVVGGSEAPTDNEGVKRYNVEGHGPCETYIFDYVNEVWLPGPPMAHGRWYPSLITLGTGETLIVTGDYVTFNSSNAVVPNKNSDTEILGLDRKIKRKSPMSVELTNYPLLHLAPNGNVLVVSRTVPKSPKPLDGSDGLYYHSSNGWADVESSNLNLKQTHDMATSVMYDKGKVMVIGGKYELKQVSEATEVIDLNQPSWEDLSTWAPAASMNFARYFHTSVLMPDGQVFVVGGSRCGGPNNIRTPRITPARAALL